MQLQQLVGHDLGWLLALPSLTQDHNTNCLITVQRLSPPLRCHALVMWRNPLERREIEVSW